MTLKYSLKMCVSYSLVLSVLLSWGCDNADPSTSTTAGHITSVTLSTDKANYNPGDQVTFTASQSLPATVKIRYKFLGAIVFEANGSGSTWTWTPPSDDFKGYMVELVDTSSKTEQIIGAIAVDVSSSWSRFPRYGFLSSYGQMTDASMQGVIDDLKRHHINGLQFYDWQDKHHQPLAGTVANPSASWKDIANRDTYKSTVSNYIKKAHDAGMQAMFYNLCYGALSDASADGVQDAWYMYKDANHTTKTVLDLGGFFKSSIFLTDPSNPSWQNYLAGKNDDVYNVFDFDGFHIDQLGDWGTQYNYSGNSIDVAGGYKSFITAMKTAHPTKKLVMNAVNQFGQQSNIATSPVDFLYTEVWGPNDGYSDLAKIIQNNNSYGSNQKNCTLAAYMNYDMANNKGYFNAPSVIMTDAVIFAFGGSHLELGEHMLCKEYFPNNNLDMTADLQKATVAYYDFLVAYENLLRDGGTFNTPAISSADGKVSLNNWPPVIGQVSVIGKQVDSRQVIHLINFGNASHLHWRDPSGTQKSPFYVEKFQIQITSDKAAKKVWFTSPDLNKGSSEELTFTQSGNQITLTVPWLKYWDMIVIEY